MIQNSAPNDWMGPPMVWRATCFTQSPLVWLWITSKNTFTDTCRTMSDPTSGHPGPAKLTCKINHTGLSLLKSVGPGVIPPISFFILVICLLFFFLLVSPKVCQFYWSFSRTSSLFLWFFFLFSYFQFHWFLLLHYLHPSACFGLILRPLSPQVLNGEA